MDFIYQQIQLDHDIQKFINLCDQQSKYTLFQASQQFKNQNSDDFVKMQQQSPKQTYYPHSFPIQQPIQMKIKPQQQKAIRKRKITKQSKWNRENVKKYWKFYIIQFLKQPHLKLSWIKEKPKYFFNQMSRYIGKSPKQCKSKDQNFKRKWSNGQTDVLDKAQEILQEMVRFGNDREAEQLLKKFKQTSQPSRIKNKQFKIMKDHVSLLNQYLLNGDILY